MSSIMSYEKDPRRFWFSAWQKCPTGGTRYLSGWAFGDSPELAKQNAMHNVKNTREICPNSFTPDVNILGTVIELHIAQSVFDNPHRETFIITLHP